MSDPDFVDGSKHFKEFYGKLNVISEIISKKKLTITNPRATFNTIFGKSTSEDETDTLKAILTKQHDSTLLIETFDYPKPKETEETDYITKKFNAGNFQNANERIEVKIKFDVEVSPEQVWFDKELVSIFNINEEDATPNIKELSTSDHTEIIKHLFTFKSLNPIQYVWESKYDMLALFNQPFLLLTFDMYYYNIKNEPLFKNNFDVKEDTAPATTLTLESLLNIETFSGKLPTFLMLLIYYAGYSFGIYSEDITSKFRNKFNQSLNKTSFPIKLYAPIPDKIETIYNNVLKSATNLTSVDVDIELLEVYHVGSEVKSLWDYVNGKLTILINNMLNSKDKDDKNRYKTLFKKQYTSNSLFLFECIDALKKYKEYILIPANITTIAFPMSTLKTLEILILKLSYILSVLEPTFIPIETMSFDVIMNGKTLKYVINSELQATNISIDDYISNDKLMSAILSTRAASIEPDDTGKAKAQNLLSDSAALELQTSVIQKQADLYRRNYLEKNIAYQRINSEFSKSAKSLEQLKTGLHGFTKEMLTTNILYMNRLVQHTELELAHKKASIKKWYYDDRINAALDLLAALRDEQEASKDMFAAFWKEEPDIEEDPDVQDLKSELEIHRNLLAVATKITPEEQEKVTAQASHVKALRDRMAIRPKLREAAIASFAPDIPIDVIIANQHIDNRRRCGFTFGAYDSVIYPNYKLGKIINTDKANIPYIPYSIGIYGRKARFTKEEWWPFGDIDDNYILLKIEKYNSETPSVPEPFWDANDTVDLTVHKAYFDKDPDQISAMTLINGSSYSDDDKKRYKTMIYKHQYLFNRLDSLLVEHKYKFTFLKPEPTVSSRVDGLFEGGKNTTKKVNRKQRQIQSKKKKFLKAKRSK